MVPGPGRPPSGRSAGLRGPGPAAQRLGLAATAVVVARTMVIASASPV